MSVYHRSETPTFPRRRRTKKGEGTQAGLSEKASPGEEIPYDRAARATILLPSALPLNKRVRRPVQEVLQGEPLSVKDVGGELLPLQAPLKPGGELALAPGAIDPLYDRLVMVTFAPLCVTFPFQSCVIVCPLGKANFKDQPLIAVVPVLVIVKVPQSHQATD